MASRKELELLADRENICDPFKRLQFIYINLDDYINFGNANRGITQDYSVNVFNVKMFEYYQRVMNKF